MFLFINEIILLYTLYSEILILWLPGCIISLVI